MSIHYLLILKLADRRQIVKAGNALLTKRVQSPSGVPHGPHLGPV